MNALIKCASLAVILSAAGVAAAASSVATADSAQAIDGRWSARLVQGDLVIPFRLDISGSGPTLRGTLYDGFEPYDGTTSATFENGKLVLNIQHYLTTITATLQGGRLTGNVQSVGTGASTRYAFEAARYVSPAETATAAPSIAGSWIIPLPTPSSKGEKAFRFVVWQRGAEVAASILRVDGDTGAYSGTYQDGRWVLSHFDGSRPGVIVVTPTKDGTLQIQQHDERVEKAAQSSSPYSDAASDGRYTPTLTAYRPDVEQAKGLPQPDDYDTHTTVRDSNQPFVFDFRDTATGKLLSNEDPRFKGKVVLAIVTGTWCPNCHDEAQYLVQLDKKYRAKGLAIVALDFEEPEQQGSLERLHAFVKQYGVKYTYLVAGAPSEMWVKVPQLVNLNTWPTTVFIGRDGLVKAIHAGFASPASGEFYSQEKQEFSARIEQLLAEKPGAHQVALSADHAATLTARLRVR
jgi:thiol-disulfide isomerase/thioredoxin